MGDFERGRRVARRLREPAREGGLVGAVRVSERARGGVAGALAAALEQRGATAIVIEDAPPLGEAAARVATWLGEGPIHGVFWLPALDAVGPLHALDVEAWRAAVHRRVKLAACVARALYAAFEAVSYTHLTLPTSDLV